MADVELIILLTLMTTYAKSSKPLEKKKKGKGLTVTNLSEHEYVLIPTDTYYGQLTDMTKGREL